MGPWVSMALLGLVGVVEQGARTQQPASAPADVRFGPLPDTNTNFQPARYASLDEWTKRRDWLRMQVRVAAGLWPEPEKCPLNAKVFGKIEGDGYTIEKVYFESYPGLYVTGNLYRHSRPPQGAAATDAAGKSPGVLCPHGHWKSGRLEQTEIGNIPARCIMLARMGCTVFAYDMVGYNDSARQFDHRKINTPELDLWGITSMHLQTWNSIRAIDFLQSLPEVDPERIGVTGASGGGTQTFMIAAVDDRVKVTCPVNMISHTMQGGCSCENAPCLRIDTNNMEIGALFAPNPMLMVSATGDWTKDTPQVEYPFIKSIYALYGKADNVENTHIDAGHNYNQQSREAMYRFFAKHLLGWPEEKANAIKEHDIPMYNPEELVVWSDQTTLPAVLSQEELLGQIRSSSKTRIDRLDGKTPERLAELRDLVITNLQYTLPVNVSSPMTTTATRPAQHMELEITSLANSSATTRSVLVLSQREGESSSKVSLPGFTTIRAQFGTVGHRTEIEKSNFFSTFNATPHAEAAFGALACMWITSPDGVAACENPTPGLSEVLLHPFRRAMARGLLRFVLVNRNGIIAEGRTGPLALIAAVFAEELKLPRLPRVIDMNRFDIDSDEAYLKELNIPHIRRIGGLRAIAAVACNGPIWFHNVGDHFDEAFVKAAGQANGVEVRVTKEKASDAQIAAWLTQRE